MAMADTIIKKAQPHLAAGEVVHGAFAGQQTIRNRLGEGAYRVVVATDQRFLVFQSGSFTQTSIKRLIEEPPRQQVLGEPTGLFCDITVGGETMKVNRRYLGQIRAIDAALSQS
ncbi:hypothetical protein [Flexivirga alba]|uniref:YokE-like PH domain-containing protein n=1 Tax=Flexivirga alba TaxID=702742 RepID=A0ABW2AMW2_9MICO